MVGIAGGAYGTLIKATDGGRTWKSLVAGLSRLGAVGANNFFAFHSVTMLRWAIDIHTHIPPPRPPRLPPLT
jgi:hypothetical protein